MVLSVAICSQILNYLLEQGENIVKKDVDNIVDKNKSKIPSEDDDNATAALVASFIAEGACNTATVDEIAAHGTGVISLSSQFTCARSLRASRRCCW